jgi:NAD(P)-dependent dehydrogenase (short-subunit alcohol dehydrogenase family)
VHSSAAAEGTDDVIKHVTDYGGVDIIAHVAGGGVSAPARGFAKLTPELWHQTLELNLLDAVRLDRGMIPAMIDAQTKRSSTSRRSNARCPCTTQPWPTPQRRPR